MRIEESRVIRVINRMILLILIMIVSVLSSDTFASDVKDPYPGMREIRVGSQLIYVFNGDRKHLLIFIDGSGLNSVLGIRNKCGWENVEFGSFLIKYCDRDFAIAIPEKLDFEPGHDYSSDQDVMRSYTVDAMVKSYSRKIDYLIDNNAYNSICIFGLSEGGLLAPRIVNTLRNRSKITSMVVWGSGGYSQAECFRILASSRVRMPQQYRNECGKIDQIRRNVEADSGSMVRYYMGWPYVRWASFFSYRPANEYDKINIPVLFIQGTDDYSSPVESVRYIEKTFRNSLYAYLYLEGKGHVPDTEKEIGDTVNRIFSWAKERHT